jgi:serine/threonine-protein kinase RsbW
MNHVQDQSVTLSIPNDPTYLRMVRLVVASMSADLGYDLEEVEDLRIVADEAVYLAMNQAASDGRVLLTLGADGNCLTLRVSAPMPQETSLRALDPVSNQLLTALTAHLAVTDVDGQCVAAIRCKPPARFSE